ncbi:MAG: lamin tail domain-containing protein [Bacteroidota bacterium]
MMLRLVFSCLACVAFSAAATGQPAQWNDDFDDSDLSTPVMWEGLLDRWQSVAVNGSVALQTNGLAESDTLFLSTASAASIGRWAFTFHQVDVNLSNANGTRVYLMASRPELTQPLEGYYLQLGTNNSDEVRLYRQDGDASSSANRVEIGATDGRTLDGTDGTYDFAVVRSAAGRWAVALGADTLFTAQDATYSTSTAFGFWVKHSSTRSQSFAFDDVAVDGADALIDTEPPTFVGGAYDANSLSIVLRFSEPIDPATITPDRFDLPNLQSAGLPEPDQALLILSAPLPDGGYTLPLAGIRDVAGNPIADDAAFSFAVATDTAPPDLVEVTSEDGATVAVTFTEEVEIATRCRLETYRVQPGNRSPDSQLCAATDFTASTVLVFDPPLRPGAYTLEATGLVDRAGNTSGTVAAGFAVGTFGEAAAPGDVAVNEIAYAPAEANSEFVELLNLTNKTFDLRQFTLADSRDDPVPLVREATSFLPDDFLVLVRDGEAFAAQFPGVAFIEVPSWPALNNGGDAVTLRFEAVTIDSVFFDPAWGGGGSSLERRDPAGPSNEATNWGTAFAAGGTPGQQNSIFGNDTEPPTIADVTTDDGATVSVTFSEDVRARDACVRDRYRIEPGNRVPDDVLCQTVAVIRSVALTFEPGLPPGDYTVEVTDILDVSGNASGTLLQAFAVPGLGEPALAGDIAINEIAYLPADRDNEFVELLNLTEKTFDVRQFTLADSRDSPVPLTRALLTLPPNDFLVLARDSTRFADAYPGIPFIEVASWPSLNNSGDAVVLRFDGATIDSVLYEPGWGGEDRSLERRDPTGPSNVAANWATSFFPSGSPGQQNSIFEIDTTAPIALYAEEIASGRIEIGFNEPVDTDAITAANLTLAGSAIQSIQADAEQLRLFLTVDVLTAATITLTNLADLKGNTAEAQTLPLARLPNPGDLVLNELMFDPRADDRDTQPDQPEYIELYNASALSLSLTALYITDLPNENGEADTTRFAAQGVTLAPDDYALLIRERDIGLLDDAFPNLTFSDVVLLPSSSTLSLNASGDAIRLHRRDNVVVDAVEYDADWHDDVLTTTKGVALERLGAALPSQDPLTWASSQGPNGGSPGTVNSVAALAGAAAPVAGSVLINEILFDPLADAKDGIADQSEYVELLNVSGERLDLNGLYWTDQPDENGVADTTRIAFTPTALAPGQFAVFFATASGEPKSALVRSFLEAYPGAEAASSAVFFPIRRSSLGLLNDAGLIRLHAPNGTVIDEVAYADDWHHPDLQTTKGVSLERESAERSSNSADNWTSSFAADGGTPGYANAIPRLPNDLQPGLTFEPPVFSPDGDSVDDVLAIQFQLTTATALVRARIFDSKGRLVRTLEEGNLVSSSGQLLWNGLDDEGRDLRVGIYVVLVESIDTVGGVTEQFKGVCVLALPLG